MPASPLSNVQYGARVRVGREDGVICCIDPLVYCTIGFRSYVPLNRDTPYVVIDARYDGSIAPLPELVRERIVRYMNTMESERARPCPTGGPTPTGERVE